MRPAWFQVWFCSSEVLGETTVSGRSETSCWIFEMQLLTEWGVVVGDLQGSLGTLTILGCITPAVVRKLTKPTLLQCLSGARGEWRQGWRTWGRVGLLGFPFSSWWDVFLLRSSPLPDMGPPPRYLGWGRVPFYTYEALEFPFSRRNIGKIKLAIAG